MLLEQNQSLFSYFWWHIPTKFLLPDNEIGTKAKVEKETGMFRKGFSF